MGRIALWVALTVGCLAGAYFAFSYIPNAPGPGPDLDCRDIGHRVHVEGPDYHRLDADNDGIGCDRHGQKYTWLGVLALIAAGGGGYMIYREVEEYTEP